MKHKFYPLIIFLFVLIITFVGCRTTKKAKLSFNLERLDGVKVQLDQYKGNVVLVDFWATWCPPCVRSIPTLIELYNKYKDRPFVILGVSLDESRKDLEKFVQDKKIPYPILIGTPEVATQFNIEGIPTMIIFDKKGKIRFREVGFSPETPSEVENKIIELLNE